MTKVFQVRSSGGFIVPSSQMQSLTTMERINSAIFSDAVFAMERIEELQSNLEVKDNPSALKETFFTTRGSSIFYIPEPSI